MTKRSNGINWGFTLMELMIVIAIMGILASLIYGNFITSLKKGRDARRKADLEQIQRALEMYYEDNKIYPTSLDFGGSSALCHPAGCNTKIYMQKLPNDPITGNNYMYFSDGSYYKLYSCIENSLDQGPGVKQDGYSQNCGNCGNCKYGISSPNTTP